jgi:hypothetical protein
VCVLCSPSFGAKLWGFTLGTNVELGIAAKWTLTVPTDAAAQHDHVGIFILSSGSKPVLHSRPNSVQGTMLKPFLKIDNSTVLISTCGRAENPPMLLYLGIP